MKDTGNFLVSTVLIGAVLGLGIWRLDFDRHAPPVTDAQRASLAACVPPTELAAGTRLTVTPAAAKAVSAAASASASVSASASASAPRAAVLTMAFVNPTAITLQGTTAAGSRDDPLRLRKADGNFELLPDAEAGQALRLHSSGATFQVPAALAQDMRFGPVDDAVYEVMLNRPQDIVATAEGRHTLAAGARGQVIVRGALSVQPLQPLRVAPDTAQAAAVLHPIRVSGQAGLSDIAVEINQPGLRVPESSFKAFACAWHADLGLWRPAGVSSTQAKDADSAKLLIALPAGAFPAGAAWRQPVTVAVASADGRYAAVGSFTAVSRPWAAATATGIAVLLLGSLMLLRGRHLPADATGSRPWFSGLFMGADGDPSLSLWQTFVWTVITIWGLLYVFIVAGSLLTLTPEMMGLLGIAGTGSVLARWIATSSGSTSRLPTTAAAPGASAPRQHLFWQMLSSNGSFDLLKLQLFVFTVLIAMYVVGRIADAAAFPTLDANTLLLMGVSQGVYITAKAVGAGSVARAQALKAQFDVGAEQIANLKGAIALREDEKRKIEADLAALAAQGAPADPALTQRQKKLEDEITPLKQQVKNAEVIQQTLKQDFEKAVAELGLVIKP